MRQLLKAHGQRGADVLLVIDHENSETVGNLGQGGDSIAPYCDRAPLRLETSAAELGPHAPEVTPVLLTLPRKAAPRGLLPLPKKLIFACIPRLRCATLRIACRPSE